MAIAITFDQKHGVKESLYKGTIYLDEHSLAFISFDISRSPLGLQYSKYGNGKMRLLLKLMRLPSKLGKIPTGSTTASLMANGYSPL